MDKMMKNVTLTARQTKAIELLLIGTSIKEVANTVNVSRGTVYRWLDQPNFQSTINKEKNQVVERLSLALASLGQKAVKTLEEALDDSTAGTSVRVRAADVVINRILSIREIVDFEDRLTKLENIFQEKNQI